MNLFKRITTLLIVMLVGLTSVFGFASSELKTASGDFFYETFDCVGDNDPGTRNPCRENGWLNYDTLSGYCVAAKKSPSQFARSLQGSGSYPGVDAFKDITLKKGKVIFGGAPGQSNFCTKASALDRSGGSASKLFDGLQVSPHPQFGFRPGVTAYEVIDDAPAAFGRTLANPQHGTGRLPQIVLDNYESVLKPIYSIPLKP